MKKFIIACILFGALSSNLFGQSNGDSWKNTTANKKGTLLCLWNEAYGIVYKDDKGKLAGVCVDILKDFKVFVKEEYGVELAIEYREEKLFERFLEIVEKSPTMLGVSTVSITEERRKRFQFSPYFISNPNVIVTHRDAPALTSLDQLGTVYKGYTAKVIAGSTHKTIAHLLKQQYAANLNIAEANSIREIFAEIENNKQVFTIIDFGEYLGAFKNRLPLVRQTADLEIDDKLSFVMGKSSDWEPVWQKFLTADYRKSENYRNIIAKNLGLAYLKMIQ